eukprot:252497-Hanusia_phi.AAC.2
MASSKFQVESALADSLPAAAAAAGVPDSCAASQFRILILIDFNDLSFPAVPLGCIPLGDVYPGPAELLQA